jgi:hypothetical protein
VDGDEAAPSAADEAVAGAAEDVGAADGTPEYVPMSEWIEDFDAAKRA